MKGQTRLKLEQKGLSNRVAQQLVKGGFHNPTLIQTASDEDLLALPSIQQDDVDAIRDKIG